MDVPPSEYNVMLCLYEYLYEATSTLKSRVLDDLTEDVWPWPCSMNLKFWFMHLFIYFICLFIMKIVQSTQ